MAPLYISMKGKRKKYDPELREDLLRPSPYLGYNRDKLGMHLLSREAYQIAESQFRRAIWLNPFEPRFKAHLAWCLFHQLRYAEANACLAEIPEAERDPEIKNIANFVAQKLAPTNEGAM